MNDTEFHTLATAILSRIADRLEAAYEAGDLDDLALEAGVLTIKTASGQTFIVSKHEPSQQIWLASPFSGGLHFSYDASKQQFQLSHGATLDDTLGSDLARCGVAMSS